MVFKWLLRIIVPVALFAAVIFFVANGVQDSSVEDFMITGLSEIDLEGFVFDAQLVLHNPSLLPVPVSNVTYNATLNQSGEQLGSGSLDAFVLRPGESTAKLSQRINWVPSAQLATNLLLSDEVLMDVEGVAVITLPVIGNISFDFADQVDISEYIQQFVGNDISEVSETIDDPVENVSDSIGSIL